MKPQGLIAATLALAALLGGVYWSNKQKAEKKDEPSKDAPPAILKLDQPSITEIRIERASGETTAVRRKGDGWEILEPKPMPADDSEVERIANSLSSLTSDRLVEESAANLGEFGLATPTLRVTAKTKDGKTHTLLTGDETPTTGSVFAKLDNSPRVYTYATYVKSGIDKTARDLRDKRLITVASDKITRVEIDSNGGKFAVARTSGDEWTIVAPKPMRADSQLIDDMVRKVRDAKMDTGIPEPEEKELPAKFAAAARVALISITGDRGVQTLEVRETKDKTVLAKSSAVEGVYQTAAELSAGLGNPVDHYRNKRLFDFRWNDPSKIEFNSTVLQKDGEKWMSGGKQKDPAGVQTLIDKLRDLLADKIVEAAPSGEPSMRFAVTWDKNNRTERVSIVQVGDRTIARREGDPAGYELAKGLTTSFDAALAAIKDYQPPAADSKDAKKK
jgi:hypothetical protein